MENDNRENGAGGFKNGPSDENNVMSEDTGSISSDSSADNSGSSAAGGAGNTADERAYNLQNAGNQQSDAFSSSGSGEAEVDYSIAAGAQTNVNSTGGSGAGHSDETAGNGNYNGGTSYYSGSSDYDGTTYGGYEGNDAYNNGTFESFAYNDASGSQYSDGYSNGTQYGGSYGGTYEGQFDPNNQAPVKKKKKMSDRAKRVLAAVLVIVLCGCAGFGGAALEDHKTGSLGSSSSSSTNVKISGDVDSLDAASAIAEKVMPSVVGISTTEQTQVQSLFGTQSGTVEGVGTGIIVSSDGYILTNSHVVSDGSVDTITVDLYDGSTYSGSVLWSDSSLDLAIVKIDATGLTAAELGNSDDVKIGDYALAIGNPLGLNYERSVTSGIISGLNRTITTQDESTGATNNMEGLIQTDAAINSGNSGGPLVNSSGQVIGINTAKASSSEGLGFAIPINTATPIIKQIKEKGTYTASYMGISGVDLSTIMANYKTNFNADSGVYIAQIFTDSPAASAGLKEGDIITAIDGKEISGMSALKTELVNYSPGDEITLTIERDKKTQKVKLTLGSESDASSSLQSNNSPSSSSGSNGSSDSSRQGSDSQSGLSGLFGN
ncbi:MAG: trypsin-like peptidase domain-containing protein [Eubacteriales bacterium]|nr:trypsin-like peptidase domain-containing protein [Eubacteriales bacterium]